MMLQRVVQQAITHPLKILMLSVIVCLSASSGLRVLQVSTDLRDNLADDNTEYLRLREMEQRFQTNESAIVLLAFKDGALNIGNLEFIQRLSEQAKSIANIDSVYSLSEVSVFLSPTEDDIEAQTVAELLDQKDYDRITQNFAANPDPFIFSPLLSKDRQVTAIQIAYPATISSDEKLKLMQDIRSLGDQWIDDSRLDALHYSGALYADQAQHIAAERNMVLMFPTLVGLAFVLLWVLGSMKATLIILAVSTACFASMFGVAAYLGIKISPQSLPAATVITGVMVAVLSHLTMGICQNNEGDSKTAVAGSLAKNITPIVFSCLTTMLGFLSMNLSIMPPIRDMGNIAAIGIGFSLFYCLFTFPALMCLLNVTMRDQFFLRASSYFSRLCDQLLAKPGRNLVIIAIAVVILGLGVLRNNVNDYFVKYYDHSFDFRVANDFADQHLAGLYTLEFEITAKDQSAVTELAAVQALESATQAISTLPSVQAVYSAPSVIKSMNQALHESDQAYYRLPEDSALLAQYFLLYDFSLADSGVLDKFISFDKQTARLVVTVSSMSSLELIELEAKVRAIIAKYPALHIDFASSIALLFTHLLDESIKSGLLSGVLALVRISLLLFIILRPLSLAFLSLVPNLLPFIIAFGAWGYLNGNIIGSCTMVIAVTLGVVVDDTIHLIYRAKTRFSETGDSIAAVRCAMEEVGPAMLLTTICLGFSFFISVFSAFLPLVYFGYLSTMILIVALVLDVTLLPIILYLLFNRQAAK